MSGELHQSLAGDVDGRAADRGEHPLRPAGLACDVRRNGAAPHTPRALHDDVEDLARVRLCLCEQGRRHERAAVRAGRRCYAWQRGSARAGNAGCRNRERADDGQQCGETAEPAANATASAPKRVPSSAAGARIESHDGWNSLPRPPGARVAAVAAYGAMKLRERTLRMQRDPASPRMGTGDPSLGVRRRKSLKQGSRSACGL